MSGGASNYWSLDGGEVRDGVGMCHARGLRWCAGGVAQWGGSTGGSIRGEHTAGVAQEVAHKGGGSTGGSTMWTKV